MLFEAIDDFLIDEVYQKITDWTQSWLGVNNFGLARLCCYLSVVALVGSGVVYDRMFIFVACIPLIFCLWLLIFQVEKNTTSQGTEASYNQARMTYYNARVLVFVVATLGLTQDVMLLEYDRVAMFLARFSFEAAFCSIFYFMACTSRPPKRGKIFEWFEGLIIRPATLVSNSG